MLRPLEIIGKKLKDWYTVILQPKPGKEYWYLLRGLKLKNTVVRHLDNKKYLIASPQHNFWINEIDTNITCNYDSANYLIKI